MALDIFLEISLIIVLAAIVAGIVKFLKQPLIIGYILTGIIVSPYFLNLVDSTQVLQTFSHIGIALLLFIVGLSLGGVLAIKVAGLLGNKVKMVFALNPFYNREEVLKNNKMNGCFENICVRDFITNNLKNSIQTLRKIIF